MACGSSKPSAARLSAPVSDEQQLAEASREQLETLLGELEERDEAGELSRLEGLELSESMNSDGQDGASRAEVLDMYENNSGLFSFTPPEGTVAQYSQAVIGKAQGAALELADRSQLTSACENQEYQDQNPSVREILAAAKDQDVCGHVDVVFCIKLTASKLEGGDIEVAAYTKPPQIKMDLPCPSESLNEYKIEINEAYIPQSEIGKLPLICSYHTSILRCRNTRFEEYPKGPELVTVEGLACPRMS